MGGLRTILKPDTRATAPAATSVITQTKSVIAGAGLTGGGALSADVTINAVANADGSIVVNSNDLQVGVISDTQHGTRGGGTQHAAATTSVAGFMSAADKRAHDALALQITAEGGLAIEMTNKTGANSVKGTVVSIYTATAIDKAFKLCEVDAADPIGIVYDAGIADGSACRVVIMGAADVLIEAGSTIAHRSWLRSPNATAGRGYLDSTPGGTSTTDHFREVGHCLEAKTNTGSTLARCILHFN